MPIDSDALGFSPADDLPVRYIDRTHAWYDAIGTNNRYRYATHSEVPFAPLAKPLAGSTVALITTAAPYDPDKGPQGAGAPYNAAAKFYAVYSGDTSVDHELRVSHVGIDRRQLTDDTECFFPLPTLRQVAASGRIGRVAPRFHGMPTNRSHRHTIETDCPEVLRRLREDGADCAVLVANCPICHQTMALLARHLEAAGLPTVLLGAAKDIVEACGVPRFVFSDVPLGNAAGLPWDAASRRTVMDLALRVLESAVAPRTTVQSPLRWNREADWKRHVMDTGSLTPEKLETLRAEFAKTKQVSHAKRAADLEGAR